MTTLHVRQEFVREGHRADTGIRLGGLVEERPGLRLGLRALDQERGVVDVPPAG
ncbi:hypothetical protein ACIBAG_06005 [Streptomyces sp. NPDC051243]|uniref:hypothetical protein n=1 Tax=Streptomyces sp. NPDC051243 TaxID=3365646 RepID=UPI0037A6DE07